MLDEMMFDGYSGSGYNDNYESKVRERLKTDLLLKIKGINDYLRVNNIYVNERNYANTFSEEEIETINKSIKKCFQICKYKEKKQSLVNEIVSYEDYFLFRTKNQILKISKSDLIEINLDSIEKGLIFIKLKNSNEYIKLDFNISIIYKTEVEIELLLNKDKLNDFLMEEISLFLERESISKNI